MASIQYGGDATLWIIRWWAQKKKKSNIEFNFSYLGGRPLIDLQIKRDFFFFGECKRGSLSL